MRDASPGCIRWSSCELFPAGLQADDDQGDVVAGAGADAEAGQQCVGEAFRAEPAVAGEGVGEAGEAGVDVFVAAFDEPVGVEDEGVAGGVGKAGLGAWLLFGVGAQGRVGGLVQERVGAVGVQQDGVGDRRCCR